MPTTHPRYSFVRINEESYTEPLCAIAPQKCLPLMDLSDLRFQVITDFSDTDEDDGIILRRIVALPCNACGEISDEDIFNYAFGGEETKAIIGSGNTGGNSPGDPQGFLRIAVATQFAGVEVGDWVYISDACAVTPGPHDYAGFYRINKVNGILLELDKLFEGFIYSGECGDGMGYVTLLPKGAFLLATQSITLDDGTEFSGNNFAWNIQLYSSQASLEQEDEACFSFCLYKVEVLEETPEFEYATIQCIGTTNCFRKTSDLCHTSKVTYGCNESAFGFYTDGTSPFEMSVRLPLFLKNAQYPGEEKGYQKSDGTFLKLSERINKTWDMETDLMPDAWHERLRVALSCDDVKISNEGAAIEDQGVYRSEAYEIDEPLESFQLYPFRKARTKLFQKRLVASVNSNCG